MITEPFTAVQGTNDFGTTGYRGPCPPKGEVHTYYFNVYGLDAILEFHQGQSGMSLKRLWKDIRYNTEARLSRHIAGKFGFSCFWSFFVDHLHAGRFAGTCVINRTISTRLTRPYPCDIYGRQVSLPGGHRQRIHFVPLRRC